MICSDIVFFFCVYLSCMSKHICLYIWIACVFMCVHVSPHPHERTSPYPSQTLELLMFRLAASPVSLITQERPVTDTDALQCCTVVTLSHKFQVTDDYLSAKQNESRRAAGETSSKRIHSCASVINISANQ